MNGELTESEMLRLLRSRTLSVWEDVPLLREYIRLCGITQSECAARLGRSQSSVANRLRLLRLTDGERRAMEEAGLSERHARALLKLETEKQMWTTLKLITDRHMNVEQTESYIASLLDTTVKPKHTMNRVFKDVRIFVNTFNKAIQAMKDSGIEAQSNKTETEEYIEFTVRIPKDTQRSIKSA